MEHRTGQDSGLDVVVGLGRTGLSLVRHLHGSGRRVRVIDSRDIPPCLSELRDEDLADVEILTGSLEAAALEGVARVYVSPGISLEEPLVRAARDHGLEVAGDIELFARVAEAPVLAVTGSNGKSTVASLLALMAECSGRRVGAGGNLGTPALELISDPEPDLYVLELSSFQLERCWSLAPTAAAVLNVSADHMDRYRDLAAYATAKGRIYTGCQVAVCNRDDPVSMRLAGDAEHRLSFGLDAPPSEQDIGIGTVDGREWILRGREALLAVDELQVPGRHNVANCMAALAMGTATGLDDAAMVAAVRTFTGLPHRTQWVGDFGGVVWLDDSKATNLGATAAAVTGLDGPLVLIAGGLGKGQDFAALRPALQGKLRALVLLGADADQIASALGGLAPTRTVGGMEEAVDTAARLAEEGDTVLLSPACASQDMFDDYADRGRQFSAAVAALSGRGTS